MLTFRQAVNFRTVLEARIAALAAAGAIGAVHTRDCEELVNRMLLMVGGKDTVAAFRLLELPVGLGNGRWRLKVTREVGRSLGLHHDAERGWVYLATGSALRLAFLLGATYEGGLERGRVLSREESGWQAEEAVAFARRFTPRRSWNKEWAPRVVLLENGTDANAGWGDLLGAHVRGLINWSSITEYRGLRRRYDAYVMPGGDLVGVTGLIKSIETMTRLRKAA